MIARQDGLVVDDQNFGPVRRQLQTSGRSPSNARCTNDDALIAFFLLHFALW
jgi:hypothetical protein